jgi:uncharacterized LabA/DUF88 family protein
MTTSVVYAFIDSQNLNLGVRSAGWKLDFRKFRTFLRDSNKVDRAFLFIGYLEEYEAMYERLRLFGYDLVFKQTQHHVAEGRLTAKGNVDAELVLHAAAVQFPHYDEAVVVSGDGDFVCLYQYLIEEGKLRKILVPNKKHYSWLIRSYMRYVDFVGTKRDKLEYKK